MTALCPSGHVSKTTDYCDQCGAKVDGRSGQAAPTAPPLDADKAGTAVEPCPDCAAPRGAGDRFCEVCGYNFVAGTPAQAPPRSPGASSGGWEAVVTADREYFERVRPEGTAFPGDASERTCVLDKQQLRIGRTGPSADGRSQVDLEAADKDPAVSRLHASLIRQADGSYAVVDHGSTNGTSVNENPTSIAANVPVPLADADRVHLGAWTTITVRYRETYGDAD